MSRFLQQVAAFVRENQYPLYSISEICGDSHVDTVQLQVANPCQNSYSVAKAFVVTALGILYDRGLLSPEDKLINILLPEISDDTLQAMDERWYTVTLDDALTHKLALPKNFLDIDQQDPATMGRDYLHYVLTAPLTGDHGLERCYTDAAYYLLSRVVERLSGKGLDAFLWEALFYGLGVQEAAWSRCPMGHCIGATGLYIRSSDMVKLGKLYLDKGTYGGIRYLSREWVELVLSRGYELRPCGSAAWGKAGMRGQMLLAIPSQNRVVAWHGCGKINGREEIIAYIESL